MFRWFKYQQKSTSRSNRKLAKSRFTRVRLEAHEDRLTPATFNVTTLADFGAGSLRSMILKSDTTVGPNVINLTIPGTYQLTTIGSSHDGFSGALQISNQSVTINNASGSSVTIDGGGIDRVFDIVGTIAGGVAFSGITIQGGLAGSNSDASVNGGGIYSPQTNLVLTGCAVTDNASQNAGGGIYTSSGTLTLNSSTVSGNTASGYGGGIYGQYGSLFLTDSTVSGNVASGYGGGVYSQGSVAVTGSTITSNSSYKAGGGLATHANSGHTLTVTGSTITDNTSGSGGGGVYDHTVSGGAPRIVNCTISGNSAASYGGGLSIQSTYGATIQGCTIFGNSAANGGGVNLSEGTMTISNSAIDSNHATSSAAGLYVITVALSMTDTSINNNRSSGYDGGMLAQVTNGATFTNVNIIGNHSGNSDGGINISDSTLTMTSCNIDGNSAGTGQGGDVCHRYCLTY